MAIYCEKHRTRGMCLDCAKEKRNDGLCRLPREAIEVEDEWQLVQDHVEDENWTEVPHALARMRDKMLTLEAHVYAKKVLSA